MLKSTKVRNSPLLFLVIILLGLFTNSGIALAQPNNLVLEVEQHWDTYGVGGTCIAGTHNVAVADVDGDGAQEIVTGGFSYGVSNESRTNLSAPLRIWSWNGQNLVLEKSEDWIGNIACVYAADADGDGQVEILTDGRSANDTNSASSLLIWNWDGKNLFLKGSYADVSASSIFVCDVDGDGQPEILTAGRAYNTSQANAQLQIWDLTQRNLTLKADSEWSATNDIARANSVYAADLDNDGLIEIVTGGYANSPKNSSGQLRVWQLSEKGLMLKSNAEWRTVDDYTLDSAGNVMGNTMVYNVKVADVDGDNYSEIATGGFTYDGNKALAQLRIWNWTNGVLNLEKSKEWASLDITELKSISINDVDSDGKPEIVTSGATCGYGSFAANAPNKSRAELKIWSWNGKNLSLKESTDWIVGEGVCAWNDCTGDLENDGKLEMVTVGCMYVGTLCDPDLRIWSMPAEIGYTITLSYTIETLVGLVVLAAAIGGIIFIAKKRRQ